MWRLLGWLSVFVAALLVVCTLTAYGFYRKLSGNIRQHEVAGLLGSDRPAEGTGAENILLIGSDTRAGQGEGYGDAQGARSDTLILLHLSRNRDHASLISFPRDSLVEIPSCRARNGTPTPPRTGMLNEAFEIGGPACSWRTIETLTGVRVDHFVQIDFAGFKHMVDALGGVDICLPAPVDDPRARLRLPAGRHVVTGEQALGYVRTRYGLGDGSDLERIERQQKFLGAVMRKATRTRLLAEPRRLYRFLDAATQSITTDPGLSLPDLRRIAESVEGLQTGEVTFVTVPTRPAPSDPNRLLWTQPASDRLFAAVRADRPVTSPPPSGGPAVPAEQVRLRVLNGTDISGLAGRTADQLRARGFRITKVGNSQAPASRTVVRYGPGGREEAAAVAQAVPGARAVASDAVTGVVELVIGDDWQGISPTSAGGPPGAPASPSPVDTRTAAEDVCGPS